MKLKLHFVLIFLLHTVRSQNVSNSEELEILTDRLITNIFKNNLKHNGWNNILLMGNMTDRIYKSLQEIFYTFVISDTNSEQVFIENVVPYHSNIILMNCTDFKDFENAMKKVVSMPYWHPLANIILYYEGPYNLVDLAKIFFIYWFYKSPNIIILQHVEEAMKISYYSPYISNEYKLKNLFTCRTARKSNMPIGKFQKSFVCSKECSNVTSTYSKIRADYLGTCIGFETETVSFGDSKKLKTFSLFEDKGKNLHGFTFFAFTARVLPFLDIKEHGNGSYTLQARDGILWNTVAKLINFNIDISPSVETLNAQFDYERSILQVFSFTQRKTDLILFPLYQFDLIVAEIDYTIPFLDSGVCILSHRAGFKTLVFDGSIMQNNMYTIIKYLICLICIWLIFFIFNKQVRSLSLDQAGKDLMNTVRTILSISIHNPPKRGSFRIFMTILIWSFFVINFSTQAAIISLFSVHKREKEIDTFEDILRKGFKIEGMASPDIVFPEENVEQLRDIVSRIEAVHDLFECVNHMSNDSRRFCLIDCAVGRYLVYNLLDNTGKQFLHLASQARIHSHYLNMILHKNSPITEHYNKYVAAFLEAGLIQKWMEYKYFDRNEESEIKSLGMEDLGGFFKCYCFLLGICFCVFLFEVVPAFIKWIRQKCVILKRHVTETKI